MGSNLAIKPGSEVDYGAALRCDRRERRSCNGSATIRARIVPACGSLASSRAPGHSTRRSGRWKFVQIDHTKLDVIVVDEEQRLPIGRPWITLAIDVYSRMVLGFYISLDPPGAIATSLCIAHAALPKETRLAKRGIVGSWPCWGFPARIEPGQRQGIPRRNAVPSVRAIRHHAGVPSGRASLRPPLLPTITPIFPRTVMFSQGRSLCCRRKC
jgi:hypothetical protein